MSFSMGAMLLYGTCVISMPACALRSSNERCVTLPLPPDPYRMEFGRAFAIAINSGIELGGNFGFATIASGAIPTRMMGLKSRGMSYWVSLYRLGLIT